MKIWEQITLFRILNIAKCTEHHDLKPLLDSQDYKARGAKNSLFLSFSLH